MKNRLSRSWTEIPQFNQSSRKPFLLSSFPTFYSLHSLIAFYFRIDFNAFGNIAYKAQEMESAGNKTATVVEQVS